MRAFFIFGLFLLSFFFSLFLSAEKAYAEAVHGLASEKKINDSLVQNLSCQGLNVDSIYAAIREDAFDERYNLPIKNWDFNSGGATLANCWALASTQRMISYLARYNEPTAQSSLERTTHILNMVRRSSPETDFNNGHAASSKDLRERPYRDLAVFPVNADSLLEGSLFAEDRLWKDLASGFEQNVDFVTVKRNFVTDIQTNQTNRFFRFGNIPMALAAGSRSQAENQKTIRQLTANLASKRLTLINLRVSQFRQHVVMAKSYRVDTNGNIWIKVYDSNKWIVDNEVVYDISEQQFYASSIMAYTGAAGALGVFLVSEDEREPLEAAMLNHYKDECKK